MRERRVKGEVGTYAERGVAGRLVVDHLVGTREARAWCVCRVVSWVGVGGHTLVGRGTPCCSCWWCCCCCSYFCSISSSCLFARVIGPLISAAACCSPACHAESKRGTCCLSRRVAIVCACVYTCCSCFRLRVIIPAGAAGAAPGVGLAAAFSPYVHPTGANLNTNAFLVVRRWSENCVLACHMVLCRIGQGIGAAC